MRDSYIEKSYNDVVTLIAAYSHFYPSHGIELIQNLLDVHDIPEIGIKIFEEEINDISQMLSTLRAKQQHLKPKELHILDKAEFLMSEISNKKNKLENSGNVTSINSAMFDIGNLRFISKDPKFQARIDLLEDTIKKVFDNSNPELNLDLYVKVEDQLMNVYYEALALDCIAELDKDKVMLIVFDLAENISPSVSQHLVEMDDDFMRGRRAVH